MKSSKTFFRLTGTLLLVMVMVLSTVLMTYAAKESEQQGVEITGSSAHPSPGSLLASNQGNKEIVLVMDTTESMKYRINKNSNTDDSTFLRYTLLTADTAPLSDSSAQFSLRGKDINIIGDIHSNNSFSANTDKLTISGRCEVRDTITMPCVASQTASGNSVSVIELPDFSDAVRLAAQKEDNDYQTNVQINGYNLSLGNPVYSKKDIKICSGDYARKGVIAAEGNIVVNAPKFNQPDDGAVCLYSQNGDISISVGSDHFSGIIYAPNGSVTLQVDSRKIQKFFYHGKIISKNIKINADAISIDGAPTGLEETLKGYLETKSRLDYEKEAAKNFIDKYGKQDTKIGVVSYGKTASVVSDLLSISDLESAILVKNGIDSLLPGKDVFTNTDGTVEAVRNIGDGIRRAYYMLKNSQDTGAAKYIIVMTDGAANVYTGESASDPHLFKIDEDSAQYVSGKDKAKAKQYGSDIGSMIRGNYNTIFIALTGVLYSADKAKTESQLEKIALDNGASEGADGKHFYSTVTAADIGTCLDKVASNISLPGK